MSEQSEPLYVDCGEHGQRVSAVVCCHLVNASGERVGFIENCSDPNDLQAWCHKCELVFEEEDGMTEKFREFNDMALVCIVCYEASKQYHSAKN